MSEGKEVKLETLLGGAVLDRFVYEIGRITENIADPNTVLGKRSLSIKFEFKPNKSRTQNDVVVKFDTKLAATEPLETTIFISRTRAGLIASEYHPNQPDLPGTDDAVPASITNVVQFQGGVK